MISESDRLLVSFKVSLGYLHVNGRCFNVPALIREKSKAEEVSQRTLTLYKEQKAPNPCP